MRMLSERMHWLTVGLALLVSAQGFMSNHASGQAPGMMPGGGMPGGGMMMPDAPMSMSFQGPPPMDVVYAGAHSRRGSCDASCDAMGGCQGCCGCNECGGNACGGLGCGLLGGGGLLNEGLGKGGLLGSCRACGGMGCGACAGGAGSGCLFSGKLLGLLGPLAPYSEGGAGAQRFFDIYAGTIGLQRTSSFGGFANAVQDVTTGQFGRSTLISTDGVSGTPALNTTDLDLEKMRYGLEIIANLQTRAGSNLEARYFGLNNWEVSRTASTVATGNPTLFSAYSLFGTNPGGVTPGFDDTDRSFIHTVSYNSELHNGEVNYRRRWVSPFRAVQGSYLAGIRYFDLDERFGFAATGSNDNTFTFSQLRFFNHDTRTRNQLTGFQIGGDMWVNVVPGIHVGVEGKGGIFGNHAEVESQIFANSIPGAREFLQDGQTAYLAEFTASAVYRLSYSWSLRGSYNLLYVDNVALAPENFNVRDLSNALGSGAFTASRFPFIDTDGEVLYQGFSVGGEYTW